MSYSRLIGFVVFTLCSNRLFAAEQFDVKSHYTKSEFRIPMRDGVHLFTSVYAPKDLSTKYPILITRTPYSVAPYGAEAYRQRLGPTAAFAQDGFIFVYQDVRGRFMSEGEFVDMRPERDVMNGPRDTDESTDTFDTIDWLLKNIPNNNGKVGILGISYPGFYTTAGTINAHPALVAASPEAPMADIYMGDDAYHNGAFFLIANFSFYTSFGKQHNPELPHPEKNFDYGTKDGYRFYLGLGPLINSDVKYFRYQNPYWTDTMMHTTYDAFWRQRNVLPHVKNIKPAMLVVGGWFDAEDLSGTLKTYRAIRTQSPATIETLVMGPWIHGGWDRGPGDKLGDISFGAGNSQFFHEQIELPFFRHYLKNAPDPDLAKAYVFETGTNTWRKQDHWPPATAVPRKLYLAEGGSLSDLPPSSKPGAAEFDEYSSDPANPVPFSEKPTLDMDVEYMDADQRFVRNRSDVLTYETTPLTDDMTVAGPISPSLFVSTSGSDSDFIVKLIDVYPDEAPGALSGYEQLVRGEPFRGKFRNSFEHPKPFEAGKVEQIHFTMPDVYHCFRKRHRIMVQIQSSWFPLVDRNPQTFTDIPTAKSSDFVKATERIYRSSSASSFVEFSVEP